MGGGDLNKQLEALKRQFMDLVRDLHARKLAVPAGALLAAIVAAVVLLPKSSTPPPAPPTATTPVTKPKIEPVAQISMIKPSSIDEDVPLSSSTNPFIGSSSYSCKQIGSNPKTMECEVGDLAVRVICAPEDSSPACAGGTGASGATGSASGGSGGGSTSGTGGSGTGGSGGSGGSTGGGDSGGKAKWYIFSAAVKIDLNTYKDVQPSDVLPNSSPLVAFTGGTIDKKYGYFQAANGVTVSGVDVDPNFEAFILKVGQSATLTDRDGVDHKITLKSLKLVPKS